MSHFPQTISCDCGDVLFRAAAAPIVTAVCYCSDCQTAGDIIANTSGVKSFREADGGTPYITLHDKHWTILQGGDLLSSVKLKPNSPTRRYVSTCCQSPMFLKFKPGFWTSTYRARYQNPPPIEWRNQVAKRQSDLPFPDDLPRFKNFPLGLFWRLFKAWAL